MNKDQELLMHAAKAAGYALTQWPDEDFIRAQVEEFRWPKWNPLESDGDAFRLAVRCAQLFGFYRFMRRWMVCMAEEAGSAADPYAASRMAIVRAAAALSELGATE